MKKRFNNFISKIKQKRLERKQKRIKKILSKILGVSLLIGVLLSLFIFPSSAETISMYEEFPVVPEGVYEFAPDQSGEDTPVVNPYPDIFPVLVEMTYPLDGISSELVFYDTNEVYYSLIPTYITFYYESMPDSSIGTYCWRFAFYDANGSYVDIYTTDNISPDIPDSISEATWVCGYVGKSEAVTVYKNVDYCKLILHNAITDARLVDLFLTFSDFDYDLNGRVEVTSFNDNTSFEINEELYDIDILYRGSQLHGPMELTYPYYTYQGALRLFVRIQPDGVNSSTWIDDSYGFTLEFHDVSIKSIPNLYCLLHVWDVDYNSQLSYFVKGKLYSQSIVVPEGLYAKLNFTSNGEQFNYISSGIKEYPNGDIERYINYDNQRVYTEDYDSDTGVTNQYWLDVDYKSIDCGDDYQFITYKLYEFLNSNYSDINSSDALDSAFNSGYESGKQAGIVIGREEGIAAGYFDGYNKGKDDGYKQGYKEGYDEGFNFGGSVGGSQGDEFMGNFFTGIVNALDAFKIFGEFSVYDMIVTLMGAFVLLFILRLIAGG